MSAGFWGQRPKRIADLLLAAKFYATSWSPTMIGKTIALGLIATAVGIGAVVGKKNPQGRRSDAATGAADGPETRRQGDLPERRVRSEGNRFVTRDLA